MQQRCTVLLYYIRCYLVQKLMIVESKPHNSFKLISPIILFWINWSTASKVWFTICKLDR
jgi:hypothetical protein